MGHNPRGEKCRVSSLLRTAANTGQVAPSRHCPLGSLQSWHMMAPAVGCPWWWSTWWCSVLSVESPFKGPPSWSSHKVAMVTDAAAVPWQEVEVCQVLQKPERWQLGVRCHRDVHFIPLDGAPHGGKAPRLIGAHQCCLPGRAMHNKQNKGKTWSSACSITIIETSYQPEDGGRNILVGLSLEVSALFGL